MSADREPARSLVLAEHVRSPLWPRSGLHNGFLDPLMVRFEADHLLREPLEHVRAEGLVVEELLRSRLGIVERLAARKSAG